MTLWIIIGALVAVVALFLIVMSIKDRKKAKIVQIEKKEQDTAREGARKNVILFLNLLMDQNDKLLKDFVPSVGKLKMGDIRSKAKKAIVAFKKTREYKFAEESETNGELIKLVGDLEHTNSNTWNTKFKAEIKELNDAKTKLNKEFVADYKGTAQALIKDAYK